MRTSSSRKATSARSNRASTRTSWSSTATISWCRRCRSRTSSRSSRWWAERSCTGRGSRAPEADLPDLGLLLLVPRAEPPQHAGGRQIEDRPDDQVLDLQRLLGVEVLPVDQCPRL